MKEVKAYVRPELVDHVVDVLGLIPGVGGIAVVPVQDYGHVLGDGGLKRTRMVKLEVDAPNDEVDAVVRAILENGRSGEGHAGDGSVLVTDVRAAYRIADGKAL